MKIKPKRKQTSNKTSLFYRYKSSNSFFICFIIHEHFTSMIYLLDFLLCCAFILVFFWLLCFGNLYRDSMVPLVLYFEYCIAIFFCLFVSASHQQYNNNNSNKNIQLPIKCSQHIEHTTDIYSFFTFPQTTKKKKFNTKMKI